MYAMEQNLQDILYLAELTVPTVRLEDEDAEGLLSETLLEVADEEAAYTMAESYAARHPEPLATITESMALPTALEVS